MILADGQVSFGFIKYEPFAPWLWRSFQIEGTFERINCV